MRPVTPIPHAATARAIAELGADRAREAWHYLDRWAAGIASGVPAHDLRHALEADRRQTESTRIVRGWVDESERGLLALHGGPGSGKTFAAVRWLLSRHDRGLVTRWWCASDWPDDFDQQDAVIRMLRDAPALVVDDLGEGATSGDGPPTAVAKARSRLAAMLTARFNNSRPTIVLSNAERAEIVAWFGGRLVSRLDVAGGISTLRESKSMRTRDVVSPDSEGRSPTWHRSRRIVDAMGVSHDTDGTWRIGWRLETGREHCEAAIDALGLDRADVDAAAREIHQSDRDALSRLAATLGVDHLETLDWGSIGPHIHQRIADGQARQEQERRAAAEARRVARESVASRVRASEVEPPASVPASLATSCRELATRYGLSLRLTDDGHAVHHGERELASGTWSQAQAWWCAAQLLRPVLEEEHT